MADGNNEYFDLTALLKMGDLDLRRVVRNHLTFKVGDYAALLLKYENASRDAHDSLCRIADSESTDADLQVLTELVELLEEIGATQIIPTIDDIIKAAKRGHTAFAADCANKIFENYDKLYTRVMSAKKTGPADGENAPVGYYAAQSLKDALQQIDTGELSRKLKVLAVDDSPVMLNTITSVLSDDFKVYGMAKPTMVEKFLEQITPDLILLDYEMPEMNGFELIPIIRKFPEHKDTPIVFLTSMGTMEHVSAAAKLGSSDFIVKPFQPDNLRDKVMKHIFKKN